MHPGTIWRILAKPQNFSKLSLGLAWPAQGIHMYIYIDIHIYMHEHIHRHTHTHILAPLHKHIRMHTYVHVRIHMSILEGASFL